VTAVNVVSKLRKSISDLALQENGISVDHFPIDEEVDLILKPVNKPS
jgi:hypothetical protein